MGWDVVVWPMIESKVTSSRTSRLGTLWWYELENSSLKEKGETKGRIDWGWEEDECDLKGNTILWKITSLEMKMSWWLRSYKV